MSGDSEKSYYISNCFYIVIYAGAVAKLQYKFKYFEEYSRIFIKISTIFKYLNIHFSDVFKP